MKKIQMVIKYIFDFISALIMSIVVLPIIAICIIVIKIVSPEDPAIFKQIRIGYKNRPFTIYKLRTMTNERDENNHLLSDEIRTKKWGHFIRATNIDEFTQIVNILKFQMSWIGPRPLLPKEMKVMSKEEQKIRQSVRPGISGWEAVNESKTDSRFKMAQYDLFYVRNWSLLFDLKIFFKTIFIVLLKRRPDDVLRAPKLPESIQSDITDEMENNIQK